ncbi:aconitase family protein, partial [Staphylococcus epidermidis]|uniref:aconitase family protein n=1 Tax=Staphylococcus epidermidis TaxID=1282 RepID=UPI0030C5C65C
VGLSEDTLKQGTRCISTSHRNFEGRQGLGVLTHIASPSVATASAVNGYISSSLDI